MKFTKIPTNTFSHLQMNAGIMLTTFNTEDGSYEAENILGATTGGLNVTLTPTFSDFGEDIDNCPKNTKELKRIDDYEAKISGTFVTASKELVKRLAVAAELSGNKVTPRNTLNNSDFADLYWVGDYTNVNDGTNAGFIAIKLMNALSTGGFQIQTTDKGKGQFAFEFTGHYSIDAQDIVPLEIYVKEGTTVNG